MSFHCTSISVSLLLWQARDFIRVVDGILREKKMAEILIVVSCP
jgi:hypothetical protein